VWWKRKRSKKIVFTSITEIKWDLLPNDQITTYFPSVCVLFSGYVTGSCELIFSPEDMQQCPLPQGYKSLLLPRLVNTENAIVAYPFDAYVVGNDSKDYFYTSRTTKSTSLYVIWSLSIDNNALSFTISFDFQLSSHNAGE
jgi:hypothetical protein